jgi:hypothetical protein
VNIAFRTTPLAKKVKPILGEVDKPFVAASRVSTLECGAHDFAAQFLAARTI